MRSRLVKDSFILRSLRILSEALKRKFNVKRIRSDRWRGMKKINIESLMSSALKIKKLKLFMLVTLVASGTSTNRS